MKVFGVGCGTRYIELFGGMYRQVTAPVPILVGDAVVDEVLFIPPSVMKNFISCKKSFNHARACFLPFGQLAVRRWQVVDLRTKWYEKTFEFCF